MGLRPWRGGQGRGLEAPGTFLPLVELDPGGAQKGVARAGGRSRPGKGRRNGPPLGAARKPARAGAAGSAHLGPEDATMQSAGGPVIEKVKLQHAQGGWRERKGSMGRFGDRCVREASRWALAVCVSLSLLPAGECECKRLSGPVRVCVWVPGSAATGAVWVVECLSRNTEY